MKNLLEFLKSQKLITIASHNADDLWITNVYYGIADDFKIYFISPESAKHSNQITKNPNIAFALAWHDPNNYKNRKGIQGLGVCRKAKNEEEINQGVLLYAQAFKESASKITPQWIHENEYGSRIWIIIPTYIKHWNDERYKEKETGEFYF